MLLSEPPFFLPGVRGATGISPQSHSWCLLSLPHVHSFQIFYFLSICSQGKARRGGNITHEFKENNGRWRAEEAMSAVAVLWFLSFLQARSDRWRHLSLPPSTKGANQRNLSSQGPVGPCVDKSKSPRTLVIYSSFQNGNVSLHLQAPAPPGTHTGARLRASLGTLSSTAYSLLIPLDKKAK